MLWLTSQLFTSLEDIRDSIIGDEDTANNEHVSDWSRSIPLYGRYVELRMICLHLFRTITLASESLPKSHSSEVSHGHGGAHVMQKTEAN